MVKDKANYFKLTSILIVISLFFVAGYSFDLLLFVLPILVRSIYHATGKKGVEENIVWILCTDLSLHT